MHELFIAAIPSAITAFCFWYIERRIVKREEDEKEERKQRQAEIDAREERREQFEFHVLQSVNASVALSEATAKALQRIPEAKCNGDMADALEYATRMKQEQREFLFKQGLKNVI